MRLRFDQATVPEQRLRALRLFRRGRCVAPRRRVVSLAVLEAGQVDPASS